MSRTKTNRRYIKCPHCEKPMKWEAYVLAWRPDALRQRDGRAPIEFAWHCRCGKWEYGEGPPLR